MKTVIRCNESIMKMKVTMKMKLKVMVMVLVMVIVRMIMSRISDRSQRIEQHRGFPVTGVDTPSVTPSQVKRTSKRILTIENALHDDFKHGDDKGQTVGHTVQVAASKNTLRRAHIHHCAMLLAASAFS